MKFLQTGFLLLTLCSATNIVFAKDVVLTCPSSGKGTTPLELKLAGLGGFELPKDQTIFLPLQFDHATMDNKVSAKGAKLTCTYKSFVENKKDHKSVILVAYAPSDATGCTIEDSNKEGKMNQLVCKH